LRAVNYFQFDKLSHVDSKIALSQANISISALFRISAQSAIAMCWSRSLMKDAELFSEQRIIFRTATIDIDSVLR
jgi:hypothetical protein